MTRVRKLVREGNRIRAVLWSPYTMADCGERLVDQVVVENGTAPLADLYFSKVWLGARFTAPGCEPVCCDGNAPMPFARGTFRYAIC